MDEIKYIDWNAEKENLERMINEDKLSLLEISRHYHVGMNYLKRIIKELKIDRRAIPAMKRKYQDESIIEAVKNNVSIAGVLRDLGLREIGGNYSYINKRIKDLNLDTSHFTGQLWNKGKTVDKDKISSPHFCTFRRYICKQSKNTVSEPKREAYKGWVEGASV